MARKSITPTNQAEVVIKSRRRCALCVGLDGNTNERPGQIAHLNGDHSDNRLENLVWLCLEHHDKFDSKTSQTKNYTQIEVRTYRDNLYQSYLNSEFSEADINNVRVYLQTYSSLFTYIFQQYSELAFLIDSDVMQELADLRDYWYTNNLRSFNSSIKEIQDHIANNIAGLLNIYEINMYDLVGNYIKYDSTRFSHDILESKKSYAKQYVDAIAGYYKQLESIATK
ncbi:HNH endonuclease [Vibrio cholerae]